MPRKKVSSTVGAEVVYKDETKDAISLLAGAIKSLETEFKVLRAELQDKKPVEKEAPKVEVPAAHVVSTEPFPHEWQEVIETVLNKKFTGSVVYQPNGKFQLWIDVPKEYSNASERDWASNGADKRMKIIETHMGAAGVRAYCDLILKNLGDTITAKIVEDRANII